ncbi:MAG: Malonyl-CoA decarboxylase, partial [Desulfuromonas sp.]
MSPDLHTTLSSLQRTLHDYTQFWRGGRETPVLHPDLPERDAERIRKLMADALAARSGEVAARQKAALLGELYLTLDDSGRLRFLEILAGDFGVDQQDVRAQASALMECDNDSEFPMLASQLRRLLEPPQQRLLQLFNGLPKGVKFLIDLRADLRRYQQTAPALRCLDGDLYRLLATWFDIGFLEMRRLTWQSPASLLEKLIDYEAVHTIQSWEDLRNRLESDRHCYAFFHPALPDEPLIFIEVALVEGLSTSVQQLLDLSDPGIEPGAADAAIFYSISNTQQGLQGFSVGPFLI